MGRRENKGVDCMNVLVIGAYGQVGSQVVSKMKFHPQLNAYAALHKKRHMLDYTIKRIKHVKLDLSGDIQHMVYAMNGMDAVVFAAGAEGDTGADYTMMIDMDGAIKAMEAAKKANVKRFIIVSAVRSNEREFWSYAKEGQEIGSYFFAAKYYADQWLINSGLGYTIIRPTLLSNEEATGHVQVSSRVSKNDTTFTLTRGDLAQAIIEVLLNDNTINKAFDITQGNIPIEEAVKSL